MFRHKGLKASALVQPSSPTPSERRLSSIMQRSPISGSTPVVPTEASRADEDGIFSDGAGVKVVVRMRPHNAREHITDCISVLPPPSHNTSGLTRSMMVSTKPRQKQFTFDFVADKHVSQQEMFEQVGRPIIRSCIEGYNGTVFAYGQTGSGKTYTMSGNLADTSQHGLIPRMLGELFEQIGQSNNGTTFLCKCSFLEIYNERITDLLSLEEEQQQQQHQSLLLREDLRNGVFVEGLSTETASNMNEALRLLRYGISNRHTSSTHMNDESSRSHSVFTVLIQSKTFSSNGLCKTRTSRLNLVDLAGSERQQSTKAEGDRLVEACAINKSLSTLAKVIMDITNGKQRHVHYRDSKLTFLLKDSLGGNSKTCIISNISPSVTCMSETVSTLQFAQRAKKIRNQPMVNEDMSGNIQLLQQELRFLRNELVKQKGLVENLKGDVAKKQQNLNNRSMLSDMMDDNNDQLMNDQNDTQSARSSASEVRTLEDLYLNTIAMKETAEKRSSELQKWIDDLETAVQSKDHLLQSTRFLLKLKEHKLAALENRKPELSFNFDDLVNEELTGSGDDNGDLSDEDSHNQFMQRLRRYLSARGEDEFSQNDIDSLLLSTRAFLVKKVLHPDMHPTVLTLTVENMALQDQIEEYEHQYGQDTLHEDNMEIQRMKIGQNVLNSQIKQLVMEKHELQESLKDKEIDIDQMKEEFRTSQAEQITQLETRIEGLEQVNREFEQRLVAKDTEINQLQMTEQRAWQLEKDLSLHQEKSQMMQQRLDESRTELTNRQSQLVEMQRLKDETEIVQQEQQHEREQREQELRHLKSQFEQQMLLWKDEMTRLKATHEEEKNALVNSKQQEILSLQQKISQASEYQDSQIQSGEKLQEQLSFANAEIARVKEEMRLTQDHIESLHENHKQQMEELRAQITLKQGEVFEIQKKMGEKDDFVEREKNKRAMQERQIERLCEQLAESNSKWRDAEARLEILEKQESDSKEPVPSDEERQWQQQQLQNAAAENDKLRTEMTNLTRQLQEMEHRAQELHDLTLQKEEMMTTLKQQLSQKQQSQQEITNSNRAMDESNDQDMTSNNTNPVQYREEMEQMQGEHEARQKELGEQLVRYKTELDMQASHGEKDKARISALLADVDKHRNRSNNLSTDIASMRNRIQELEAQNAKLIGHQNPKQKIQSIQRIKEENNTLRKDKQGLEVLIKERENLMSRLRVQLTRAVRGQGANSKDNAAHIYSQLLQEINNAPSQGDVENIIKHSSSEQENQHLKQVVAMLASATGIQENLRPHMEKSDYVSLSQTVHSILATARQQRQQKSTSDAATTPGGNATRRKSMGMIRNAPSQTAASPDDPANKETSSPVHQNLRTTEIHSSTNSYGGLLLSETHLTP